MRRCEDEARKHGFSNLELMATLPGIQLYERHGFRPGEPIDYELERDLFIQFVPMSKHLGKDHLPNRQMR